MKEFRRTDDPSWKRQGRGCGQYAVGSKEPGTVIRLDDGGEARRTAGLVALYETEVPDGASRT